MADYKIERTAIDRPSGIGGVPYDDQPAFWNTVKATLAALSFDEWSALQARGEAGRYDGHQWVTADSAPGAAPSDDLSRAVAWVLVFDWSATFLHGDEVVVRRILPRKELVDAKVAKVRWT